MRKKTRGIIIPPESRSGIKRLSQEQKGYLLDAIYAYNIDGEVIDMDMNVGIVFDMMKDFFDNAIQEYDKMCDRNAENGRNGGRPKKETDSNQNNPVGFQETDSNPLKANKSKVNIIKLNKTKEKKQKTETEVFVGEKETFSLQTISEKTPLEKKLDEFLIFRKAIKKEIVPASREAFIRKLRDMSLADETVAIQILDNSIANGWQGIFPIDNKITNTSIGSKNSISKIRF